jgi:hypothetical protein
MVAYLLFFGGMSGFVFAGTPHTPALAVVGVALAIIALGCGDGRRVSTEPLEIRTAPTASAQPAPASSPAICGVARRQQRFRRHRARPPAPTANLVKA